MFSPRYTITDALATNMREIGKIIGELNSKVLSSTVLTDMERDARVLSAHSSTQIEGNPLPLTDVKKIIKSRPENLRDTEREILNYNKAILMLDEDIRSAKVSDLSNVYICKIQSVVMNDLISQPYNGKYRTEPVFVNDPVKGETIYLPPDAKDVEPLMNELIVFINESKKRVDPLIIAGLFHKQAVIIHPFMDGNGRTTRLVTKMLLAELGINTFPLFSFENYYNKNVTNYFKNVGVFGNYYEIAENINFTEWLEYFAIGIIDELNRVKSQLPQYEERIESHHKKILEYIKEHGSITMREYEGITDRARATRIMDFKRLVDLEMISSVGVGKSTYYVLKRHSS
ncbi:MAG: Fic family protein [Candidatus Dojkabacteria bacterium]|nr:MAG: Fic family protein [Candidatus Dojkabacteria bacterium]